MLLKVLKTIATYFFFYLSGCFLEQSLVHFTISLRRTADLEILATKSVGFMRTVAASQFGNALYSMILLALGLLILIVLKNKFKPLVGTLTVFAGFAVSLIMLSLSGIMK